MSIHGALVHQPWGMQPPGGCRVDRVTILGTWTSGGGGGRTIRVGLVDIIASLKRTANAPENQWLEAESLQNTLKQISAEKVHMGKLEFGSNEDETKVHTCCVYDTEYVYIRTYTYIYIHTLFHSIIYFIFLTYIFMYQPEFGCRINLTISGSFLIILIFQISASWIHWIHSAFLAFLGFRVRKKLRRKEDPNVIGGTMGPIDEATYCLTSRDTLLKMHVSSRAHMKQKQLASWWHENTRLIAKTKFTTLRYLPTCSQDRALAKIYESKSASQSWSTGIANGFWQTYCSIYEFLSLYHDLLCTLSHSREIRSLNHVFKLSIASTGQLSRQMLRSSLHSRGTRKKVASDYCMTEVHCGSSMDIGTYSDVIL